MNLKDGGELGQLVERRRFQVAFEAAEIGAAGNIGEVFVGQATCLAHDPDRPFRCPSAVFFELLPEFVKTSVNCHLSMGRESGIVCL